MGLVQVPPPRRNRRTPTRQLLLDRLVLGLAFAGDPRVHPRSHHCPPVLLPTAGGVDRRDPSGAVRRWRGGWRAPFALPPPPSLSPRPPPPSPPPPASFPPPPPLRRPTHPP